MRFQKLQAIEEYRLATYTADHSTGRCVCAVLGFATNSYSLNSKQNDFLAMCVPHIMAPDSVLELYARTDRSGADGYNLTISRCRLEAVQQRLSALAAPGEKVYGPYCKALGERFEAYCGLSDGTSYRGGRAVWAFFWPSRAAFEEGPDNEQQFRDLVMFGRGFVAVF